MIIEQDKLNVAKEKLKVDVEVVRTEILPMGAKTTKYAANVRTVGVFGSGLFIAYTAYKYIKSNINFIQNQQETTEDRHNRELAMLKHVDKYTFLF